MIIESIGTATPRFALKLEDRHRVAELYVNGDERDRWFVPVIFEKSTVQRRHCVLMHTEEGDIAQRQSFFPPVLDNPDEKGPSTAERMIAYESCAADLAQAACEDAFAKSPLESSSITHLVTASCTGLTAPGFDLELIDRLHLSPSVQRTHLGFMGCHAGLNCLRVAAAYTKADPNAKVLVCTTELCTLHYQYVGENDQKIANALFGDGAGAVIVIGSSAAQELPQSDFDTTWQITETGSYVIPQTSDMMSWRIRDHGFTMGLSEQIPEIIKQNVPGWFDQWLADSHLTKEDIKSWAVHPGGPQILNAFEQAMELPPAALAIPREILKTYGNMSSATIFFVMKELARQASELPCVAVGFGPGITLEATLFTDKD